VMERLERAMKRDAPILAEYLFDKFSKKMSTKRRKQPLRQAMTLEHKSLLSSGSKKSRCEYCMRFFAAASTLLARNNSIFSGRATQVGVIMDGIKELSFLFKCLHQYANGITLHHHLCIAHSL
ncbi:hypothetical protein M8C21_009671, partial [Ambrosia artemisiifolia]